MRKLGPIVVEMFVAQANEDGTSTEHPDAHKLLRILEQIIEPTDRLRRMTDDDKLTPKSILKMSIHFRYEEARDFLMKIAATSKENALHLYIDDLADLKKLLNELTPTANEFLENCFSQT